MNTLLARFFLGFLLAWGLLALPVRAAGPSASASSAVTEGAASVVRPVAAADEVLFLEDNVSDWSLLAGGARPNVEVVRLDSRGDGLAQMARYLQGKPQLAAIHLVSHGNAGVLNLGALTLDTSSLPSQQAALLQLGHSLKPGGGLLLYGCDVARGDTGAGFVDRLAALTGAPVAASINLTGARALGGDWVLESAQGFPRVAELLSAEARAGYGHLLQTALTTPTTIDFASASQGAYGGGSSYDYGGLTFSVNGSGGIDTFNPVANFLGITLSNFSGNGIIGDYTWTGTTANHVTTFTFQANFNVKFKLTSLDIAAGNGGPAQIFTVTGYTGGPSGTAVAQVTGFNITVLTNQAFGSGANSFTATRIGPSDGSGYGQHLAFTGSNWQNIDTVVFRATGQNDITLGFDNIVLDNPVSTVPGPPTSPIATAGDSQATITFTAPSSNGGSAITTYTATASPGGAAGTCAGPSACAATVIGLTNGTAYTFTVTATNSAGTGSASVASNNVTPKATQTITFANPGSKNFGTSPTLTATVSSGLTPTFSSSTTGVCTITSGGTLTFVSTGTCTINASQAGNTTFQAATPVQQSFTVNGVVTGAPTIGTATAGDTQATVTFTAPGSNGGATITGYTVTASPGGATGSGIASPITVTGLTNGTAYTFTVIATNGMGTSSASAPSNSITPQAAQAITFAPPGDQTLGTTPTLTASASSGLAPTFTSGTTAVCTITTGGTLTFVTTGNCTINVDQAGNASYLSAPRVTSSFTVVAASLATSVPGGAGTVTTAVSGLPAGCGLTSAQSTTVPGAAVSGAPAGYSFPYGVINFTVSGGGCSNGITATVTLIYPAALPAGSQFWKYGKTSGNNADHWYQLTPGSNNVIITGNTVTYTVTDGGNGDDDLLANGVIVDPAAPAVPLIALGAVSVPTLSEWGLLTVTALLGLGGAVTLRGRRLQNNGKRSTIFSKSAAP